MPDARYVLITVVNRDITTKAFTTHHAAVEAMHNQMIVQGGLDKEIFDGGWGQTCSGDYYGCNPWGGYVNSDKYDMDWRIAII